MASDTAINNPHVGHGIKWPIILNGCLHPSRGNIDVYEFCCHDKLTIDSKLPLIPGNPYQVTVSECNGKRKDGILVTCEFNKQTVKGRFHRYPAYKPNKGIWIGTDGRRGGKYATKAWHKFISYFGITVGVDNKELPVYLELHPDPRIVIRLRHES